MIKFGFSHFEIVQKMVATGPAALDDGIMKIALLVGEPTYMKIMCDRFRIDAHGDTDVRVTASTLRWLWQVVSCVSGSWSAAW